MNYAEFFEKLTGHPPFPWQSEIATGEWPTLLDIPTGLGKTAGVVGAWLYRRARQSDETPRRLIYCLPTRALVEQTVSAINEWLAATSRDGTFSEDQLPECFPYLGGNVARDWMGRPEQPAIIVGTQDLLVSAALNRGYAISRFVWPMAFGLLHNDALWVFDETQLMGPALPNSAQIDGLRSKLGTIGHTRSLWMSATLRGTGIETYDHPAPREGFPTLTLGDDDRGNHVVQQRLTARKRLQLAKTKLESASDKGYPRKLADEILAAHEEGTRTLVIVNTVKRAQEIYGKLRDKTDVPTVLLHSRFREAEKKRAFERLAAETHQIVVATQVIEAGVDLSCRTMFTEAAPFSAIVQRVGRCNRYGEYDQADVHLVSIKAKDKSNQVLPYSAVDIEATQRGLKQVADMGPRSLTNLEIAESESVYSHLREKDLARLFHNDADLLGDDIDISPWIRDGEDTDVTVYWRELSGSPDSETSSAARAELCRVSIGAFKQFLTTVKKRRKDWSSKDGLHSPAVWSWDFVHSKWQRVGPNDAVPGRQYLITAHSGGYDTELGWTGNVSTPRKIIEVSEIIVPSGANELSSLDSDQESTIGKWVPLTSHLEDVGRMARSIGSNLRLGESLVERLESAGNWHDVGKAHPAFQDMLKNAYDEAPDELVAKSPELRGKQRQRRYFRHELASAIAYMTHAGTTGERLDRLVAYLIMSHHGKIRTRVRSVPTETEPPNGQRFARGVWDGDSLPALTLGDGRSLAKSELTLDLMAFGESSWSRLVDSLLDDPELGPFQLAYYEAVFRAADWRASAAEEASGGTRDE